MKIARLIGAAGSGKTTELLRIMEAALPKLGGDPLRLGFASFTRAARAEAVSRAAAAWGVAPSMLDGEGWFRTVHSTARRCLGLEPGQLIGGSVTDTEWISNALGVKVSTSIDDDTGRQKFVGGMEGAALTCWERARNTLQPLDEVVRRMRRLDDEVPDYAAVVRIAERYEMAKRIEDRLDFSDLLLRFAGFRLHTVAGVERIEPEGGLPPVSAWLFDEQQDASPLLDAACKRLVSAESVKWCYVVGDPFQAIFGFAGSSAECFLGWPAEKERTMPKSYRCPKPILELGERCLRRMYRGYFDRKVAPADHEGRIFDCETELPFSRARPDEEWLFVARTNYEANRLYAGLHAAGKPAKWVTQQEGATVRGTGLAALYALEKGQHVSGSEWARAIELLPCTNKDKEPMLARGVKTGWGKRHADEWDVIFPNDLEQVGATAPLVDRIRSGKWCGLVDRGEEWRRHAERWGPKLVAETKIRVGTIHCSPPDEPVFTTDGYVPIGELDPNKHFLCAFDRKGVRFIWGRRGRGTGSYVGVGYTFKKCWRPYEGTLLTLSTDMSKTRVTPEHRVTVRYAESFFNKHIVYLMRKNNCWRVGIATSAYRRPYVSGGLNGRLATEGADVGWILSVHETREEAMFHEAVVQAKYGISGMRFRSTGNISTLSSQRMMEAHEQASPFVSSRVALLMADYGLVFDMPLYQRDGKVRSDRSFDTAAGNILSGYMEMATVRDEFLSSRCARDSDDATPVWLPCKRTAENYSGPVFSLDVAPHHHYISGGAAVHNSVKGMEADNVALLTTVGKRVEQGRDDCQEQHDEECRIAYVGVTRARRNLYVVNEGRHGKIVPRMEVL